MPLQKLIHFLYTWEVRLGIVLSISIQTILLLFGSRRKISKATWLEILVWCAYVSADAVAIFSLGLLAKDKEKLHLLWVPFLILHLGGPDTITAYSLEDNNLWLRHLLNLVIQVGVALYAIIISWNNHNPLVYLVIPIYISGALRYYERIWALKSASLKHLYHDVCIGDKEVNGTYFSEVYKFLFTLTYFLADELLHPQQRDVFLHQGHRILEKTSCKAFRLVEVELGLVYDLLYTKASLIFHSRLGIYLRFLYSVSSVATLTAFVIIHQHNKHNESKWPYPLSDVLITYLLMIGAVILEIYAWILVVSSDWTLIWLDEHQFLFRKISTCRGVFFSEKRWSRSLKQYTIDPSPTVLKRIKDCFFDDGSPFSPLVPSRWRDQQFEFEYASEAGDDAEQKMKEEVFKVIKDWLDVSNRRPDYMTLSEFISESGLKGLWESTPKDGSDVFGTSLFSWFIATNLLMKSADENIEEPDGSGSRSQYDYYKASSKYLSGYLMYLVCFRRNMLPPGNFKHLCTTILPTIPRMLKGNNVIQAFHDELREAEGRSADNKKDWFGSAATEQVFKLADSLINYFDEKLDRDHNKWEIISKVWAHMLVYAAASQNKWEEHAQQLRRGGEFLTHVAVLFVHASTSKMIV